MQLVEISIIAIFIPLFSFAQSTKETGQLFINKLFQKQYMEAATFFDESIKEQVTPSVLEQTATAISQQLGAYKGNLETNEETHQRTKNLNLY